MLFCNRETDRQTDRQRKATKIVKELEKSGLCKCCFLEQYALLQSRDRQTDRQTDREKLLR